jgi:hypothetical protein
MLSDKIMCSKQGVKVCNTAHFHQFSTPKVCNTRISINFLHQKYVIQRISINFLHHKAVGCSLFYRDSNCICASIFDFFLLKMIHHNKMFNSFVSIGITRAYMKLFYYFRALFYPSLSRKVDNEPSCSIESG